MQQTTTENRPKLAPTGPRYNFLLLMTTPEAHKVVVGFNLDFTNTSRIALPGTFLRNFEVIANSGHGSLPNFSILDDMGPFGPGNGSEPARKGSEELGLRQGKVSMAP